MLYAWQGPVNFRGILLRRLLSAIRLRLTSAWLSMSSSYHYNMCSRSVLLLLCRLKDADIREWKRVSQLLVEVCGKMSDQITALSESSPTPVSDHSSVEWQQRISLIEQDFARRDELKDMEVEKLKNENVWLQNRLSEKLQQTRHQNDVIDSLKRELIESVQQTEISEGRRLCYEHKIKVLEEQLEKLMASACEKHATSGSDMEESSRARLELTDCQRDTSTLVHTILEDQQLPMRILRKRSEEKENSEIVRLS